MSRIRSTNWLWLLAYLAMVAGVTWAMLDVRERMLAELDTPAARAEWEAWRQQIRDEIEQGGPVARRVPPSPEPNLLVLLRDYFATCLAAALSFTSLLFLVLMLLLRGVMGHQQMAAPTSSRGGPNNSARA